MGGMVSQTVLNLVDTAMVGRLGTTPLAATGLASYVNVVSVAFLMGIAAGVQAKSSHRIGRGRSHEAALPLNAGLLLCIGIALPITAAMIYFAPAILALLNDDAEIKAIATPYLQIRQIGVAAVGINFVFRGYWNAVERPRLYLRTLLLVHATNIVLNWVLIFGHFGSPAFGAVGAGAASAVAVWVGAASHFYLASRYARRDGFFRSRPTPALFGEIAKLAIPAGAQQLLFFVGMTAFFSIVGRLGAQALAAGSVLMNLSLAWILPANAFGLAAASFAGQAFGANDPEETDRWVRQVARLAAVVVGLLAVPALFVPDLILSGFLAEADAVSLARAPLRLTGASMALEAVGIVMLNAHFGVGAMRRTLILSTVALWVFCIPAAALSGPILGKPFVAVWCVWVGYRMLLAAAMTWSWWRRDWAGAPATAAVATPPD
jgi:putative MATE family efflux protein